MSCGVLLFGSQSVGEETGSWRKSKTTPSPPFLPNRRPPVALADDTCIVRRGCLHGPQRMLASSAEDACIVHRGCLRCICQAPALLFCQQKGRLGTVTLPPAASGTSGFPKTKLSAPCPTFFPSAKERNEIHVSTQSAIIEQIAVKLHKRDTAKQAKFHVP